MGLLILMGGLALCCLIFYLAVLWGYFGELPEGDALQNIDNYEASEVYSQDGVMLGKYFIENRTNIEVDKVPKHIANALIATEDARFYKHGGVDFRGLMRVVFKTVLMGKRSAGGGSTISQQLVKNVFKRQDHGKLSLPVNKVREMIVARRLEKIYSKKEILALYLNTVPFGGNVFGIEAAANRFFNKKAGELEAHEAALLIGMLKATTAYNPRLNPEMSLARRNVVLNQMGKYDYLDQVALDSLIAKPIQLNYTNQTHNYGLATYFREFLRLDLLEWCKANTKPDGTNYNLYVDGLKIYTTLNSKMQDYAEQAVAERMKILQKEFYKHSKGTPPWGNDTGVITDAKTRSKRYRVLKARKKSEKQIDEIFAKAVPMKIFDWQGERDTIMSPMDSLIYYQYFLNAGLMAMDPNTGAVKAWVGGIDYKYFKYDHVRSKRQVGSTFKPFVYATAIENGVEPCRYYQNELRTYVDYEDWTPENADGEYGGSYSLQGGMSKSINTVSVQVILDAGMDSVVTIARKMGISSKMYAVPSLALGTPDVSLYEMVGAYGTFANGGVYTPPNYLLRIEDAKGNIIVDFEEERIANNRDTTIVFSKRTAAIMTQMLRSVVDSGTAKRLRYRYQLSNDIGGKTGTTQSQADGWFMGITPKIVAGAWVGAEDRRVSFSSLSLGQGAHMALPIWALFMKQVYEDPDFETVAKTRFKDLPDSLRYVMDCNFYMPDMAMPVAHFPANWPFLMPDTTAGGTRAIIVGEGDDSSYDEKPPEWKWMTRDEKRRWRRDRKMRRKMEKHELDIIFEADTNGNLVPVPVSPPPSGKIMPTENSPALHEDTIGIED